MAQELSLDPSDGFVHETHGRRKHSHNVRLGSLQFRGLLNRRGACRRLLTILLSVLLRGACLGASAGGIQFDAFVGYDGFVRPGSWNPVVVEAFNEGPSRGAVVEVSSDRMGAATVRVSIELPTQSRKRLVIPFFCAGTGVECRLLAEDGRVLAQRPSGQIQMISWNAPLLGSMSDSPQGGPALPEGILGELASDQPRVVRLRVEMFPDSALALESLSSIYVSPSKASALREGQVGSLLQWVACGGQLVVGLDRPGDLASLPWLRTVGVPEPQGVGVLTESAMVRWLNGESWNPSFALRSNPGKRVSMEDAGPVGPGGIGWAEPIQFLRFGMGRAQEGFGLETPWIEVRRWGRGQVLVLGFNPEREPVRSWSQRSRFWSHLCGIPPVNRSGTPSDQRVLTGLDVLLADLVDTRQVRKVPISFLLALLVVYLAVIGPGDRWLLGRIRRPMLTWLSFPIYVLLFSGLIYLIGYRLRSGQTEWNELQIVDVIPKESGASSLLRCRTYGGLYSPVTGSYPLDLDVPLAGVRSELRNLFGVRLDSGRVTTTLGPRSTSAEVQASLWMKNLAVTEWIEEGQPPIEARQERDGRCQILNLTGRRLGPVWLSQGGRMQVVESIEAGGTFEWRPDMEATSLVEVLGPYLNGISEALSRRERSFAADPDAERDPHASLAMASGFTASVDASIPEDRAILWPRAFSLSGSLESGSLVVQAWVPDPGVIAPLNRFPAARRKRESLLRLIVPPSTSSPALSSP